MGGRRPRSGVLRGGWEAVGSGVWNLYGVLTVCKCLILCTIQYESRRTIPNLRITQIAFLANAWPVNLNNDADQDHLLIA